MDQHALLPANQAQALKLADAVQLSESGIVSRTVLQTPGERVVLFSFADGQELTAHTNRRRALVQILQGSCDFFFAGEWRQLDAGTLLHLPPNDPHAVRAGHGPFSMLLTLGTEPLPQLPMHNMNTSPSTIDPTRFDVRAIPCREKHARILQRWHDLPVGAHFVLVNDHDPVPLYHQFSAHYPGAFDWEYLATGPEEFQVKITRLAPSGAPTVVPEKKTATVEPSTVFDVREIPGRVKHAQIFQRWLDLPVGSYFVLLNDHDPIPLRYQFEAQFPKAFAWDYLATGPEEFRVRITKLAAVAAAMPVSPPVEDVQQIDARGLEPPEPLIRILDTLESLPAGQRLRAITDREPCHLFGEAEARGFRHASTEQPDGSWITLLDRA